MILIGLVIVAGVLYYLYKTNQGKLIKSKRAHNIGAAGENEIASMLKNMGLNGYIFNNIYIQFNNGKSTEIDLIFLTDRKIYVIESKNYNGIIYGDAMSKNWTVQYRNGKSYNLYNPIMQNNTHINALKNRCGITEDLLESVVVFGDGGQLNVNSEICINTRDMDKYIINSYNNTPYRLNNQELAQLAQLFGSMTGASTLTKMKHINQINRDHRSHRS